MNIYRVTSHPALRSEALLTRTSVVTFVEVASYRSPPQGCNSRCMAQHSSWTLWTGFYLFYSCMLYVLRPHPPSACNVDVDSEVEYSSTFLDKHQQHLIYLSWGILLSLLHNVIMCDSEGSTPKFEKNNRKLVLPTRVVEFERCRFLSGREGLMVKVVSSVFGAWPVIQTHQKQSKTH